MTTYSSSCLTFNSNIHFKSSFEKYTTSINLLNHQFSTYLTCSASKTNQHPNLCLNQIKLETFGQLISKNGIFLNPYKNLDRYRRPVFGSANDSLSESKVSKMNEIISEEQFDSILESSESQGRPIIIDWMAKWCRKCIYLKPKVEKLSNEFPDIDFFYIDVNNVPQTLVKRANISKMPTIQLWIGGKYKSEIIGAQQAWIVMEEIKKMIKNA